MGVNKNLSKTERKHAYDKKLRKFLDEYSRVLIAEVGNVGSTQLAAIRRAIRGESEMLMGKNTLIRRCIKVHAEAIGNDKIKALIPLLHGNVGLIFTKADLKEVRDEVSKYKVEAPARVGQVAPIDVVVPPGKTGLDPSQTSFFQVLNIPTKINKGTVEIVSPVDLIKKGDKVGSSEAALLAKLGIRPFSYGLEITNVYDDGSVFSPEVLDLTDEDLIEKFASGVSMVASLSLAVSYPTMAAAPHMFLNGYKNVLAVAIETNYSYPQADEIKFYLQDINDSYAEPAVTNSGLSDLPPDIIEKLLNHGLCRRDWAHLRCTDKSLKAKVDNAKKPMQLPWLLLPSTTNPMYYITDEATHGLRLPNNVRKANRIAGAHEGDWIFLADDKEATPWKNGADDKKCTPSRNRLYNLTTGREIPLPDQIVCDGQRAAVSIRSATLAGSPDSPDGWVVVAIVTLPNTTLDRAAFCNKSMQLWEDRGHVSCQRFAEGEAYLPYDNDLLDVVYLDGSFYILTEDEEVMRLV
uniref:Uncharacterized protein n=1 Tax=Avena sativa TaxID=4498 RepID=A0ACD5VG41_AVESA